jgi:hypothetical protein
VQEGSRVLDLIRQGLSSRLVQLDELRLEFVGESDAPQVCVDCYMVEDECICAAPELWSISAAIYKLRAELSLAGDGSA